MSEPTITLELRVPKPLCAVVGAVVGAILLTAFLVFFVSLAIYDLTNSVALIPSILWLALVAMIIFGFFKEWGLKQALIKIVGVFAPKQFIWVNPRGDTRKEIHYGFQVFGHRFSYWRIPVDKVTRVNWSTGQGTHLARRDMDDWSIAVWYEHGDPARTLKETYRKNPEQDLYIVGPSGKKEDTAAFGRSFLDLLRKSGVSLFPGEDESSFQRDPIAPEKI